MTRLPLLALLLAALAPAALAQTTFAGDIIQPGGITQLEDGRVLVVNVRGSVLAFDADGTSQGTFASSGLSSFVVGVEQLADGTVLVADNGNDVVRAYDPDGTERTLFASDIGAYGILQLSDGRVLVASEGEPETSGTGDVLIFAADGTPQGTFASGFDTPSGLLELSNGRIVVTDFGSGAVVSLAADGSDQRTFATGFEGPSGVTQLEDGTVLVADFGGGAVLAFEDDGTSRGSVGDGFSNPDFFAQLADGRILVTDDGRDAVLEFSVATVTGVDLLVDTTADDQPYNAVTSRTECTDGVLDGDCSLREAIQVANQFDGNDVSDLDTIGFEITEGNGAVGGVATITPGSALPALTDDGIEVDGSTQPGSATATEAAEAVIGVVLDGASAGGGDGLTVRGSNGVVRGLVIGNFTGSGIVLEGNGSAVTGTFVGTDPAGTDRGNGGHGISVDGALFSQIGGSTPANANTIGYNGAAGIYIGGSSAFDNNVQGSYVGTNRDDADLGNASFGIEVSAPSSERRASALRSTGGGSNLLGGIDEGEGNTVAFNGADGIFIGDGVFDTVILGNAIRDNGGLGIDLEGGTEDAAGVTANDVGEDDGLLNYPTVVSAIPTVNGADVTLDLSTTPNGDYRLEVFASAAADPSGFGEGARFVAATTVRADGNGDIDEVTLSIPGLEAGDVVTATASQGGEDLGVTSEFSQAVPVAATVQFAQGTATVSEGGTVDLEVTLSTPAPASGVSVDVSFIGSDDQGADSADLDGFTSETVSFAAGETTQTVTVSATDDGAAEGAETFNFTLLNEMGATVGSPSGLTLTVGASAQTVSVAVAPSAVTVLEGETAFVTASLTTGDGAPLSEATPFTISLVGDGSTADNDDFASFAAGNVTFDGDFPETVTAPAGTPSGTVFQVPIPAADDGVDEDDEVANLRVTSASGNVTVTGGDVAVTIEDAPAVAFQQASYFATEGETVEVVLELSEPARGGETIAVFLVDDEDEATTSDDLSGFDSQTVTFGDGDTEATVTIEVTADGRAEDDEAFRLALGQADAQPNGLGIGDPAETTLTISLSTPAVEFASTDLEAAEGETVAVSLRLSDAASGGESVTVVLEGASPDGADADDLGGFTSETVTFDDGDTEASFEITVPRDGIAEGEETFTLVLEDADGLDLADGTEITLTVVPSRTGVRFADSAFMVAEGSTAILTLELGSPAQGGETVEVAFAGGTDGAGLDDIAGFETETVTFAAGDTTATIEVAVVEDGRTEDAESFTFQIQNATGLDVATPDEAVLTVDPSATTISFGGRDGDGTVTVNEAAGSFVLEVEFGEPLAEDATFDVVLASSSDDADDSDPAAVSGAGPEDFGGFESVTVEVEAGATSATVEIPVTDDGIAEGTERFEFEIQNATGGGPNGLALGDASVTVILEDDDNPTAEDSADLEGAVVGRAFPNPTTGTAYVELSVDVPQAVRVTVVDAVGRVVQVLDLEVSGTERVEVGGGLAPGVYLIQVAGATVADTQQITVAR